MSEDLDERDEIQRAWYRQRDRLNADNALAEWRRGHDEQDIQDLIALARAGGYFVMKKAMERGRDYEDTGWCPFCKRMTIQRIRKVNNSNQCRDCQAICVEFQWQSS